MVMVAPPGKVTESHLFVHLNFIICICTSIKLLKKRNKVTKVISPSDQNTVVETMLIFLPETEKQKKWTKFMKWCFGFF